MRVTRAALVWVFGVAATFLGVGPFGGVASSHDNDQVLAAPSTVDAPMNPVRETKAPSPAIGGHVVDVDGPVLDLAPHVTPTPIVADLGVRPARAPPATDVH